MRNKNEFGNAWYAWQHLPEPIENFRGRRYDAPSYRLEYAIDHLASHVYSLGSGFIARKDWYYRSLASDDLKELEDISSQLENSEVAEDQKEVFRQYIEGTRILLSTLISNDKEN